jgi:biopolymer transport protein ExbB/TolQ
MEIIYFLSGVGAVLLFLSVVFVSGLASRISELEMEVKNLIQGVDAANQEIDRRDQDAHRRIDHEVDRTNKITEELEKVVSFEVKEIYSTIDSRLDKLEQKLTGNQGAKQVIKG